MRIFVTGATGFIGTALVPELIQAGYQVLGLTRSEERAKALRAAGAEAHRGTLNDLESLRSGAAQCDGVIHLAFQHDFSNFKENSELDRRVIEAMGATLTGSDRPLIVTSGTGASRKPGQPATEDDPAPSSAEMPRGATEEAIDAVAARGVRTAVVRLPQVHNPVRQGLISYMVPLAREKNLMAYVGDGSRGMAAVHVSDAARLYRLVLDNLEPGLRYNAVAEESVPARDIAETIARGLSVPVASLTPQEAAGYFGWLSMFAGLDMSASSALTRQRLGWRPTGPGLIADLEKMQYPSA